MYAYQLTYVVGENVAYTGALAHGYDVDAHCARNQIVLVHDGTNGSVTTIHVRSTLPVFVTTIVNHTVSHETTSCDGGVFVISILGASDATFTCALVLANVLYHVYVTHHVYAYHVATILWAKLAITFVSEHEYHVDAHCAI